MAEHTVGEVAGIINVSFFFLQFTLPLLQALVLVGFLHSHHTAVTWSVVSRYIQSTLWPTLLNCDTAAGRKEGVKMRVVVMTYMAVFTTILGAIAGTLAPIGLGETVQAGQLISAIFDHAVDTSIFGTETSPRDQYTISRSCAGLYRPLPCPGVDPSDEAHVQADLESEAYMSYIRDNITKCFSSGTNRTGDLRSSPFDIQFRKYWTTPTNSPLYTNTTGDFSMLENVILNDKVEIREGVVIDGQNGGIGFRNHTVPMYPEMNYGATWTEDLLWVEPVTVCVDTNWTKQTKIQLVPFTDSPYAQSTELKLINHGFFNTYNQTPAVQLFDDTNSQNNPDLYHRAFYGAQLFGSSLSKLLYLTPANETIGMEYTITEGPIFDSLSDFSTTASGLRLGDLNLYARENYDFPSSASVSACEGNQTHGSPSIDRIFISCGFAIPPPLPINGNFISTELEEARTQSIQFCASSLRASVKETTFLYNGSSSTASLDSLTVVNVQPKRYSKESEKPVWGVENPGEEWNISSIQLLWGIVDGDQFTNSKFLWTLRQDHLYLPLFGPTAFGPSGYADSMGASRGPGLALINTYGTAASNVFSDSSYDGRRNRRLLRRWQNLSASSSDVAKIPNLIWTDLAANMLVGTKSVTSASPSTRAYEVRMYQRRIVYNYFYAIPGLLCWAIWVMCVGALMAMASSPLLRSRISPNALRSLINRLCVGRALVAAEYMEVCPPDASTREWVSKAGKIDIELKEVKNLSKGLDAPNQPCDDKERRRVKTKGFRRGSLHDGSYDLLNFVTSECALRVEDGSTRAYVTVSCTES